jgi:predicted RNA-binding protein with PIN domain
MPYLIDGHNLIPKVPGLSLDRIDDEIELVNLLQEFCQRRRRTVEVYFDQAPPGQSGAKNFGLVIARFVRQEQTADQAIQARLTRLGKTARQWTVVSSDRMVQSYAQAVCAPVLSSEEFARQVMQTLKGGDSPAKRDEPPINDSDVDEWLEIFGEK